MSAARPRTPRARTTALFLAGIATLVVHIAVIRPVPLAAQQPDDPPAVESSEIDPALDEPAPLIDEPAPEAGDPDRQVEGGDDPSLIEEDAVDQDAVDAENRKMIIIVGGLIAIAFAILLLTIRYWRVTRPVPADPLRTPARGNGRRAKRRIGRRSRRSIAGADHAGADDDWIPRTTGEHEIAVDGISRQRPSRASRSELFSTDS